MGNSFEINFLTSKGNLQELLKQILLNRNGKTKK